MKSSIVRKATFNAAHRLYREAWSYEENLAVFGKCAYTNYHGHNYDLRVMVIGDIDQTTGFVYDIAQLKALIKEEVTDKYDHKNLNLDTTEFKNLIPTVENLAKIIYEALRARIAPQFDLQITLYETPRIYCIYPAKI
ncbi:MAG: 6-carboxytetrahydropterin synthase [Chitinophagales bacterium]|jgi:6-pyruvoyltetrahydropterin/6-carboxytetrahydropterin synthase|nr:6-carboxytetrahydropterin synthase [Chitinophagales bacterium]